MHARINEAYAGLDDIGEVRHFSPEQDSTCFREMGAVLDQHKKSDRFMTTLLHTHFPVSDHEAVVEQIESSNREVVKRVFLKSEVGDATPVSWRLTTQGMLPLEFTASPELYDEPLLTDADQTCLEQLTLVLAKHNALLRFGIGFLNANLFDPRSEVLSEHSDVDDRVLRSEVVSRNKPEAGDRLETSWLLRPSGFFELSHCFKDRVWPLCSPRTRGVAN